MLCYTVRVCVSVVVVHSQTGRFNGKTGYPQRPYRRRRRQVSLAVYRCRPRLIVSSNSVPAKGGVLTHPHGWPPLSVRDDDMAVVAVAIRARSADS